jgi:hypothetical protein
MAKEREDATDRSGIQKKKRRDRDRDRDRDTEGKNGGALILFLRECSDRSCDTICRCYLAIVRDDEYIPYRSVFSGRSVLLLMEGCVVRPSRI